MHERRDLCRMNQNEILSIFRLLTTAYPRHPVTPETIELYRLCLAEYEFEDVRDVVLSHVKNSEYFPSIAEIRRHARTVTADKRLPSPQESEDANVRAKAVERWYAEFERQA